MLNLILLLDILYHILYHILVNMLLKFIKFKEVNNIFKYRYYLNYVYLNYFYLIILKVPLIYF